MRIPHDTDCTRLYALSFLTPFGRAAETPWYAKATAAVAAAVQFVWGEPFLALLVLLIAVDLLDYIVGSALARREGRWTGDVARAGAIGKGSAIALVLIVRGLEAVLAATALVDTHGAASVGLIVLLIVAELRSFEDNKTSLTGNPTPGLTPLLDFLDGLAGDILKRPDKPS